jgi:hypothetical protein
LWPVRVALLLLLAAAVLLPASEAGAARVLVLDHGHVIASNDPYAGRPDLPVPQGPAARVPDAQPAPAGRATAAAKRRTVIGELKRLWGEGRIDHAPS